MKIQSITDLPSSDRNDFVETRVREIKCRGTVLGWPVNICCTLILTTDRKQGQQVEELSIDYIVNDSGQEVTASIMEFSELKALLKTVRDTVEEL